MATADHMVTVRYGADGACADHYDPGYPDTPGASPSPQCSLLAEQLSDLQKENERVFAEGTAKVESLRSRLVIATAEAEIQRLRVATAVGRSSAETADCWVCAAEEGVRVCIAVPRKLMPVDMARQLRTLAGRAVCAAWGADVLLQGDDEVVRGGCPVARVSVQATGWHYIATVEMEAVAVASGVCGDVKCLALEMQRSLDPRHPHLHLGLDGQQAARLKDEYLVPPDELALFEVLRVNNLLPHIFARTQHTRHAYLSSPVPCHMYVAADSNTAVAGPEGDPCDMSFEVVGEEVNGRLPVIPRADYLGLWRTKMLWIDARNLTPIDAPRLCPTALTDALASAKERNVELRRNAIHACFKAKAKKEGKEYDYIVRCASQSRGEGMKGRRRTCFPKRCDKVAGVREEILICSQNGALVSDRITEATGEHYSLPLPALWEAVPDEEGVNLSVPGSSGRIIFAGNAHTATRIGLIKPNSAYRVFGPVVYGDTRTEFPWVRVRVSGWQDISQRTHDTPIEAFTLLSSMCCDDIDLLAAAGVLPPTSQPILVHPEIIQLGTGQLPDLRVGMSDNKECDNSSVTLQERLLLAAGVLPQGLLGSDLLQGGSLVRSFVQPVAGAARTVREFISVSCTEQVVHFNNDGGLHGIQYVLHKMDLPPGRPAELLNLYTAYNEAYSQKVDSLSRARLKDPEAFQRLVSECAKAVINLQPAEGVGCLSVAIAPLFRSGEATCFEALAGLFAVLSVHCCEGGSTGSVQNRPHPAQVLAVFEAMMAVRRHGVGGLGLLTRILTEEHKSVVLGVLATALALQGFEVNCVSRRDDNSLSLFQVFDVADRVHYGTMDQLCERVRLKLMGWFRKVQLLVLVHEAEGLFLKVLVLESSYSIVQVAKAGLAKLADYAWKLTDHQYMSLRTVCATRHEKPTECQVSVSSPHTPGDAGGQTPCGFTPRTARMLNKPTVRALSRQAFKLFSGQPCLTGTPSSTLRKGVMSQRKVSVKSTTYTMDDTTRDLLLLEVECMRKAQHPNVATVHGYCHDTQERAVHIVIEPLHESVASRLCHATPTGRPYFAWHEFYNIVLGMLRALHHIHRLGMVHAAINPEHVMLRGQTTKLVGFAHTHHLSEECESVLPEGPSRHYLAPEQPGRGRFRANTAWDIYSAGCVAWQMIDGRCPEAAAPAAAETGTASLPLEMVRATPGAEPGLEGLLVRMTRQQGRLDAGGAVAAAEVLQAGRVSLLHAAQHGHLQVVEGLLRRGASANARGARNLSPLHVACAAGQAACVASLLGGGASHSATTDCGAVPLYCAALGGYAACVRHLLAAAADPCVALPDACTPLHAAAAAGSAACISALLGAGASINAKNARGSTALHEAARHGRVHCVTELLASEADVDVCNNDGETALHCAAASGDTGCVATLVEGHRHRAAFLDAPDNYGQAAVHLCMIYGHTDLQQYLWGQPGEPVALFPSSPVVGEPPVCVPPPGPARFLLGSACPPADTRWWRRCDGTSPLHDTSMLDDPAHLVRLLDCHSSDGVATADVWGRHPLHCAAQAGSHRCAAVLLEHGASVNTPDASGRGPLHHAAHLGHILCLCLLMQSGADLSARTAQGHTALQLATARGSAAAVALVLQALEGSGTMDALHSAVSSNHPDVLTTLCAKLPHLAQTQGTLEAAARSGHTEVATTLIATTGQEPSEADALIAAASQGHTTTVQALLATGISIDIRGRGELTPLMAAAHHGQHATVQLLLHAGASPGLYCTHRRTALHYAAIGGSVEALDLLLGVSGLDVTRPDSLGRAPLWFACAEGHSAVVIRLLEVQPATSLLARAVGGSPLHQLCLPKNIDALRAVRVCTSWAFVDETLAAAVDQGNTKAVQRCLDKGGSPEGSQMLCQACAAGHISIVALLLGAGASVTGCNAHGQTPEECVKRAPGHTRGKMLSLLRHAQAKPGTSLESS